MPVLRLTTFFLGLLWMCSLQAQPVEEVVTIAHVSPLTGPQALYGKDNENGVRMALEEINAQQRVIGGRRIRFKLLGQDDRADVDRAKAVAYKLCAAKVSAVIGHLNSAATLAAASVYHACGLPHITVAATNPEVTQAGYATIFRLIANDNQIGVGLANYAADRLKVKTVAVLDDRTAYGRRLVEVFKRTALQRGLKVVMRGSVDNKTTDFMATLASVQTAKPDALFFGGMYTQAAPMLQQMAGRGMQLHYLGGDGLCSDALVLLSGQAATLDQVVCAAGGFDLGRRPLAHSWRQRYEQRFPGQFQLYSPYAYDAVYVLVDAMRRADSVDPKVFAPYLHSTHLRGVTADIAFESNGELLRPAITLFTFRQGKKVAVLD